MALVVAQAITIGDKKRRTKKIFMRYAVAVVKKIVFAKRIVSTYKRR